MRRPSALCAQFMELDARIRAISERSMSDLLFLRRSGQGRLAGPMNAIGAPRFVRRYQGFLTF